MADRAGTSSSAAAGAGGSAHNPRAPAADEVGDLLDNIINTDVSKIVMTPEEMDAVVASDDQLALNNQFRAPAAGVADLLDINTDASEIVMTTDEMDEAMASLEARDNQFRSAMETGKFVERVLDTLVEANRWLDVAEYLGKSVRYHATGSVLPVPAGTQPEDVHAQLFLSPHTMYAYELVADGDRAGARSHYNQYLKPLRASCANGYVRNLFTKVELTIKGTLFELPNVAEAGKQAAVEIFPSLKPSTGKEPSPIWMFGELVHREEDGTRGFRCFSCHQVVWNSGSSHLRNHLEDRPGTVPCPAVAQCTLNRLAAIPLP